MGTFLICSKKGRASTYVLVRTSTVSADESGREARPLLLANQECPYYATELD